jgi:DNA-binding transcriptional MerR regulator
MALQEGKLFYTISEVAMHLEVTASTLRFWEKEIPALKPRTNKKGNRQYTLEDVHKIQKIKFLVKDQKHTVKGAKQKLKVNLTGVESQTEVVDKLWELRSFLVALQAKIG